MGMSRYFTKAALHAANVCEKRCSASLVVRDMQH